MVHHPGLHDSPGSGGRRYSLPADLRGAQIGCAASELQFGLAASYFDATRRFAVGPELTVSGAVAGRDSFSKFGTSVEAMLTGHYNIARMIQVGLAFGGGFARQAGTPDFRACCAWLCPDGQRRGRTATATAS